MNYQFNPQSPYETKEENAFEALLDQKMTLKSESVLVDETPTEVEITNPIALRAIEELYRAALDNLPEIDPLCPMCQSRHGFYNLHRITSATA